MVWVLSDLIFPIYNAFLEFAGELLVTAVPQDAPHEVTILAAPVKINTQFTCSVDKTITFTADSVGFPDSPKQMMDCMICAIDNSLSFGMTLAFETLRGNMFTGWIVGIIILACFLFVKLGFVFYLVDTIFRFTVMVVMLPIMILGYPFPKTKDLLSQGVKNMLNSAAFMMFFALVITMCIQAISTILDKFSGVLSGQNAFNDISVPFICMLSQRQYTPEPINDKITEMIAATILGDLIVFFDNFFIASVTREVNTVIASNAITKN